MENDCKREIREREEMDTKCKSEIKRGIQPRLNVKWRLIEELSGE